MNNNLFSLPEDVNYFLDLFFRMDLNIQPPPEEYETRLKIRQLYLHQSPLLQLIMFYVGTYLKDIKEALFEVYRPLYIVEALKSGYVDNCIRSVFEKDLEFLERCFEPANCCMIEALHNFCAGYVTDRYNYFQELKRTKKRKLYMLSPSLENEVFDTRKQLKMDPFIIPKY